jgi:hypothetical protein
MGASMAGKIVGMDIATEALGMSKEEFTMAVKKGYFPRALIFRFGDIEKYDLDGLLEYGRTGCIPFDLKIYSGRSMLRRLLSLEARIFGIMKSFELSSLSSDGENPVQDLLIRVRDISTDLSSGIEGLKSLDLHAKFESSRKDLFDLEERIDELTKALIEISELVYERAADISSAANEVDYFIQDFASIKKIKTLSAKSFFENIDYPAEEGVDVDELLDWWEQKDIDEYLKYVENLATVIQD